MERTVEFQVRLLGHPKVLWKDSEDRQHEVIWPLRRALLLFAYLALRPGFEADKGELMEAGWWDEEGSSHKNFHPTLTHMRRSLVPDRADNPLVYLNSTYRLNPQMRWSIDIIDFDRHVAQGEGFVEEGNREAAAEEWQSAWRLCRGPLLAGYEAPWLDESRERQRRSIRSLLTRLGELWAALGELEKARGAFRSVLVEDPLREEIHLELMRLYAAEGRRDLVRRQYGRLCDVLLAELGAEPAAETVAEVHRLLS